jgi:hypothetical protein
MVDESRPEFRLLPGETGGRPTEFREFSTFSFDIASLKRFDMASATDNVSEDEFGQCEDTDAHPSRQNLQAKGRQKLGDS